MKLDSAEDDVGKYFVDKLKNGSISGVVTDDQGAKLAGAIIKLNFGGVVVDTRTTGSDGIYSFTNLIPGDYVIKDTNLAGFPLHISHYDNSDDSDPFDSNTA